ncbi:hypothetical protein BC827DRAFT_1267308 [Russula dissimulans]|nr:hypothetical protein BC827DRAFT_1267308 [Russula dissimulans]
MPSIRRQDDDAFHPSPSGKALAGVPLHSEVPSRSGSLSHSDDVLSNSANVNIDVMDPGFYSEMSAATLQGWPSHKAISSLRTAHSERRNEDATGAYLVTGSGQPSRNELRSANSLPTSIPTMSSRTRQATAETRDTSELDVVLDACVRVSQNPVRADDPQLKVARFIIAPSELSGKSSLKEARATQNEGVMSPGPILPSASMQLCTQPHHTATPPASQNIPPIPAAREARKGPPLSLSKTATPITSPQTPGQTAASSVTSSPPQPASPNALGGVQPRGGQLIAVISEELPEKRGPRPPPGKLGVPIANERSPSGASTEASNNARDKLIGTQPLPLDLRHPLATAEGVEGQVGMVEVEMAVEVEMVAEVEKVVEVEMVAEVVEAEMEAEVEATAAMGNLVNLVGVGNQGGMGNQDVVGVVGMENPDGVGSQDEVESQDTAGQKRMDPRNQIQKR